MGTKNQRRSQGAKIIIAEECALIPLVVFFEVICPMLLLDIAALIAISTVRGKQNFFSRLRDLKDDAGEPVFNTVDYRLECKRPGCITNPEKCTHYYNDIPAHLSVEKANRVALLMKGEEQLMLQEIRGQEIDPSNPQFNKRYLNKLFDIKNRFVDMKHSKPGEIYLTVDPNAGGLSMYAIASFVYIETIHTWVLVGLESFPAKTASQQHGLFIGHIRGLFSRKEFENHFIVVAVESNLGFESGHHHIYIQQEPDLSSRVCMLTEARHANSDQKYAGFLTTNATKSNMCLLTSLKLQEGRYSICNEITSVEGSVDKKLGMLENQLGVFSAITKPATSIGGLPSVKYTGKHVATSDDLAMVFLFLIQATFLFNSPSGLIDYAPFHEMKRLLH